MSTWSAQTSISQSKARAEATADNIQVVDPNGKVVASSRAGAVLSAMPTGASFANSLIAETLGPIQLGKNAGTIDWIMTAPILGLDDPTVRDQEVHLVNAQHLIVYSSDWGILKDDQALIAMGALKANGEGGIYEQAGLSDLVPPKSSTARITDSRRP